MVGGQTLTYRGYDVSLFPMDYMYCTQTSSPTSYSHCCGHPCDWIGSSTNYPIYAPFTCECIYADGSSTGNQRIFTSTNKVWTPSGLTYVSFLIGHDDYPLAVVGTTYNQGDVIGHTGMSGQATGDHVHLDQSNIANATIVDSGLTCTSGNRCYNLDDSQYVYDIFYIYNNETIIDLQGMTFTAWGGKPSGAKLPIWIYKKIIDRKRGVA